MFEQRWEKVAGKLTTRMKHREKRIEPVVDELMVRKSKREKNVRRLLETASGYFRRKSYKSD